MMGHRCSRRFCSGSGSVCISAIQGPLVILEAPLCAFLSGGLESWLRGVLPHGLGGPPGSSWAPTWPLLSARLLGASRKGWQTRRYGRDTACRCTRGPCV